MFNSKKFLIIFSVLIMSLAVSYLVFAAWTEPTQAPPGGNVLAPINVGPIAQSKADSTDTTVGTLGIGMTTGPISQLHVYGGQTWGSDLSIDASGTTGGRRWLLISTGGTASEGQGKFLIKDNNESTNPVRLTIDTAGNVGIGTMSPGAPLEISGTKNLATDIASLWVTDTAAYNTTTPGGAIEFRGRYDSAGNYTNFGAISGIKENITSGNYSSALAFYTRVSGSSVAERMRINSSGNVGIGTTTPATRLEVKSNDPVVGRLGFGDINKDMWFDGGNDSYFPFVNTGDKSTGRTSFDYGDATTELLTIFNRGGIGIGTNILTTYGTSAEANLEVKGDVLLNSWLYVSGGDKGLWYNTSSSSISNAMRSWIGKCSGSSGAACDEEGIGDYLHISGWTPADEDKQNFGARKDGSGGLNYKRILGLYDAVIIPQGPLLVGTKDSAAMPDYLAQVHVVDITEPGKVTAVVIDNPSATNPRAALVLSNGNTNRIANFAYDANGVYLNSLTSRPLVFRTSDTDQMKIDSSGNVGIGPETPNPAYKLDINGNVNVSGKISTGCELKTCSGGDWTSCDCPSGKYIQAGGCDASSPPYHYRASYPSSLTAWQCGGFGSSKTINIICCRQD